MSRDQTATKAWLKEWVLDVADRQAYLDKLGEGYFDNLGAGDLQAEPVNYGRYD